MYNNPYGGYGGYPQQPIVFIPSPGAPAPGGFDIDGIQRQIAGLEALKKLMKEDKKDDHHKKSDKPAGSVILTAMFMLLMSPVTGPAVFYFFKLSGMMH